MKKLYTQWGDKLNRSRPWQEYPRPQLRRNGWQCLNGLWEYAFTSSDSFAPDSYQGEICVPFSPESLLSGVERQLTPGETLWYRRSVLFDDPPVYDERLMLHFGGVDQRCEVFVNGNKAGEHQGGYHPFSLDITQFINDGENQIAVAVTDDSDTGDEPYGKQKLQRGGIWYTAQSGIWQTVWCEWVPATHVESLKLTPSYKSGSLEIEIGFSGGDTPDARVVVSDGSRIVADGVAHGGRLTLAIPNPHPWSPDDPFLYDLGIAAGEDRVASYFGLRDFGLEKDSHGHTRITLNGRPIFQTGLLDQGYWSDGLYTPPSDEAMVWELKTLKSMGFNMLRKHIKIEPLRWYYHCDRLGMIVWQDFPSGGNDYPRSTTQVLPFIGRKLKDDKYENFGRSSAAGREIYYRDLERTVKLLYNSPAICLWVPFNEGWGQFDALEVTRRIKELDPTRLVDHASGWHDQGGGDIQSSHIYYKKYHLKRDRLGRAIALTEFGGYSLACQGHTASEEQFGYKVFNTRDALQSAVEQLYRGEVIALREEGLCASVYTQVSDVEDEINGIFTYDRREVKFDIGFFKRLNNELLR